VSRLALSVFEKVAWLAVEGATQGVQRRPLDAFGARTFQNGIETLAVQSRLSSERTGREAPCLQDGFECPVDRHGLNNGMVTQG
jgi:hypothetical protein